MDNWCAPTTSCLMALCRAAGFARAELRNRHPFGSAVACYRDWGNLPGPATALAPQLLSAVNPDTYGINFQSAREEYVTCSVASTSEEFTRDSVFPEVDGYGVRPTIANPSQNGASIVVFKLPPGLAPGWHQIRLRTAGSHPSAPIRIAVDFDAAPSHLEITGACDSVNWQRSKVSIANGFLSLWITGLPENADIANVQVRVAGRRAFVNYVGAPDEYGVRQVNVRVTDCRPSVWGVSAAFGAVESAAVEVEFVP
jgi:hypothetical protein